jgi:ankyrin repeat protein
MENIEYICELIIENDNQIYFDNEEHFENFLKSPKNVVYYEKNFGHYERNNILFYLAYKKYDLMEKIIKYGLFDNINVNQFMNFYHGNYEYYSNILLFSCRYSKKLSSDKIVEMLLEHPKIDVNLQNNNGWTALMVASRTSNTDSTEETVKMLLEHSKIDVNLQNKNGWTALMIASRTSNTNSTENTVKMLLEHPNIDINLQSTDKWNALTLSIYDCKNKNLQKMKIIWKLFTKHKIKHNMFYLHEEKKDSKNKEYIDGLKEYMKFQRLNLIGHRRYYRKHILNKGY